MLYNLHYDASWPKLVVLMVIFHLLFLLQSKLFIFLFFYFNKLLRYN